MNKFVGLLVLFLLFGTASSTAQSKVTVILHNAALEKLMRAVSEQTHYSCVPAAGLKDELVTANFQNTELFEMLDSIVAKRNFTYRVDDSMITFYLRSSNAQKNNKPPLMQLSGLVLDSVSSQPISNVTVLVRYGENASKKTMTDAKGSFIMRDVPLTGKVGLSCIGYDSLNYLYSGPGVLQFNMVPKGAMLGEIVSKGYYSTSVDQNTGSIGSVKAGEIAKQPVGHPILAIQGRIPGLFISQSSGITGADLTVWIRGANSMAGGNMPYYIIDGVAYNVPSLSQAEVAPIALSPLANFSWEDIERVDVLKDADASAIYGSRAANGVILITTKSPTPGKARLRSNVYTGFGQVASRMKLMNTQQYLQMRREGMKQDGIAPRASDYDLNGAWDTTRNTDWQKELIGGLAKIINAHLSLSGGSKYTQFRISGVYRQEGTVYPGNFLNRFRSFRGGFKHKSLDSSLRVTFGAGYTYNTYLLPQRDLTKGIFTSPNAPALYKSKGLLNWQDNTFHNPMAEALRTNTTITESLLGNLSISYDLCKWLQFKSSFGYNMTLLEEVAITPYSSWMPNTDNPPIRRINATGNNDVRAWTAEPQLNFSFKTGAHRFEILTGATFQQNKTERSLYTTTGFLSDDLIENPGPTNVVDPSLGKNKYKYAAAFARVGYDYSGKYILNFTGRRDGSSRFGPEKNLESFGAIGAAWLFSKEQFSKDHLSFIKRGKLRGSWGKTGNDQILDGRFLDVYGFDLGYSDEPGLSPAQLNNPKFEWESIYKTEVALELDLSIGTSLNLSWYYNYTTNQLIAAALPGTTGFPSVISNLPAKVVNTGIEIDIRQQVAKTDHLLWNIAFNLSIPRNRLASFPSLHTSPYANKYALGHPLNIKFVYPYTGVDKNTGIYTFGPKNDAPLFIGQHYYGGLNNSLKIGRFNLDIFFHFVKQEGYLGIGNTAQGRYLPTGANQPIRFWNRWTTAVTEAPQQKFTAISPDADAAATRYRFSTEQVGDASYVRLKNLCISYTVPDITIKKLKITDIQFYMQGLNLFTFTKFDGMDPETQAYGLTPSMPPLRMFTCGLQMTL